MALRTATLEKGLRHDPRTDEEWKRLALRTVAAAKRAVIGRDTEGLVRLFRELDGWGDPGRAFQARCRLTEVVLSDSAQLPPDSWGGLYAAAAEGLLDALEAEPREPVLLNYAAVLLYELTELGGAEALFRAAARLDPALPHVQKNLAAVRTRKRSNGRIALRGPLALKARALSVRARRLAGAARVETGLTLSVCMIVKDEEEMLPGCLEQLRGVADEVVVVDTGSSDRTREIAESFGARVVEFPWNGSFADARNASLEAATGDWILYLDADEHVEPGDAPKLRELLGRTWREVFSLPFTNFTGASDSGAAGVTHLAPRLFRNRAGRRFTGRVHERLSDLPYHLPERFETVPVRVRHYGYLKSRVIGRDKSRRNLELLEREAVDAPGPFTSYNLGVEYARLGVTDEAIRHFDAAWQELGEGFAQTGFGPSLAGRLAACKREAGDDAGARAVLDVALRMLPEHTDYVLQLALLARDEGDLDEAERLARRCLELGDAPAAYIATVGSGTFFALAVLADVAAARGDEAEAERLWRRSLADHPEYLAPILRLVPLLARRGEPVDAIEAQVPDGPTARLLTATALLEAARAADAERLFGDVLESEPSNPAARVGVIEALLSQRRYADAAAAAANEPEGSLIAEIAAVARMFATAAAGDAAGLDEACTRAAELCDAAETAFYRAWLAHLDGGDPAPVPAEAAAAGATALEALLRVEDVDAFVVALAAFERIELPRRERQELLARIYLRRGFLESAADEWIEAAQTSPDARAYVGLAQVARARGLVEDALVFADAAVTVEPTYPEARKLRDALRAAA